MKPLNGINISILHLLLFILIPEIMRGQDSIESPAKYLLDSPLEYVNFFTDRDFYISGETIWFTAQCLLKEKQQTSPLSKVLYLELFCAEKKPFRREKFGLVSGKVSGSIQIPEELPSGNYFLRAYTQYLRNFPCETWFTQCLTVINPETALVNPEPNTMDTVLIIPHGLAMVRNLPAAVGIRIPSQIMQKAQAFYVVDQNQNTVGKVEPYANGLAKFNFTPLDSASYYLKAEYADGHSALFNFPEPVEEGYSIQTEFAGSELVCTITRSKKTVIKHEQVQLVLLAESSGELFKTELNTSLPEQTIRIPGLNFENGVYYLVIKDEVNTIRQFKTLFVALNQALEIPIHLDKDIYVQRELIEAELINPLNNPEDTVFLSVSVVKHGTTNKENEILPYQVMDNPGLINAYLLNSNNLNPGILDQIEIALLLKNKESLKSINKSLNNPFTPFVFLPEIRDVSVSGFVRGKKTGLPAADVRVFVAVLFRNFQIHSTKTKEDGSFIFSLNYLTGNHDLFLYANQNQENELELFINNDFSIDFPEVSNLFQPPDTSARQLIEELWINHQLSQNFPEDSSIKVNEIRELPFLFGDEMITVKLDDYIGLNSMKEVFDEIIPFVKLKETNGHFQFSVFDKETEMLFRDPLILLDHIPVSDPDEIMKIHPSLVNSVGVITRVYVLGSNTFQGVISIQSKTGDFAGISYPAGSVFVEFQTLTPSSKLTFPVYDTINTFNKHMPDFRTLLFWDDDIKLSTHNHAFTFFTSDHCSDYDIIVRGFTRSGKYCYGKTTLKVSGKTKQ